MNSNALQEQIDVVVGHITELTCAVTAIMRTHPNKNLLLQEFISMEQLRIAVIEATRLSDTTMNAARQMHGDFLKAMKA